MTTLHCPALAEYAQLWLSFRDAALRVELIAHREACPICTRLREVTIERRRSGPADIHSEIPIQFPEQVTERLAAIMRRLYQIVAIRPGDIGWPDNAAGSEGGRGFSSIRISEQVSDVVSETAESEVMK